MWKNIRNLKTKKMLFGVTLIATMFAMVSLSVSFIDTSSELSIDERIDIVRDRLFASATNGTSGSVTNGASVIVNIMISPHEATPATAYADFLDEADMYEHFDASFTDSEELEGETPHSTTFDIICIYQYADEHAYDTDWNEDLVDMWCNESQLSISSQKMEHSNFYDEDPASDAKINFYLQDADGGAGTGFTITQLEQIDDIQFKAYYYG